MYKKLFFILLILMANSIFFYFCTNKKIKKNTYKYPQIVINKNVEQLYDSAKWIVYSSNYHNNGIEVLYPSSNKLPKYFTDINLSACSLTLDTLITKHDTIIFIFNFYFIDTANICYPIKGALLNTVLFIDKDSTIYRSCDNNFDSTFMSFIKRYETGDTLLWNGKKVDIIH